jgi:putative transcriptional regulator
MYREWFWHYAYFAKYSMYKATFMKKKARNRIKVVLAEKGKTNNWLAEELGMNRTTVSKWCTNQMQPTMETLFEIAEVLDVDVRELLVQTKK